MQIHEVSLTQIETMDFLITKYQGKKWLRVSMSLRDYDKVGQQSRN